MILAIAALFSLGAAAQAETVTIAMVNVGNAGNGADDTGYGSVGHDYQIGRYEVTAGQYTAFLNAVADTDTYGLYKSSMWSSSYGCKIQQTGSEGSYSYSVAAGYANRPVNYVSWGDAARFANWLHNNQPIGAQGSATTEDGAYYLNGATSIEALMAVTQKAGARFFIPTENEWYKAAYHKNDGVTANYWDYPTGTDSPPGRDMSDTTNPGNNANYSGIPWPIDSPYYTTLEGEFQLSDSPYGTFDQGGNVWERNETAISSWRGLRGGSFYSSVSGYLLASSRYNYDPTYEYYDIGFRVASVPEPGSLAMVVGIGVMGLLYWRRRHA